MYLYHPVSDNNQINTQVGLLALTTLRIRNIAINIIERYKENLQSNTQARIWARKDVHDNDEIRQLKQFIPSRFIDTVCNDIIYNKVPDDLINIGIEYYPFNKLVKIPILGVDTFTTFDVPENKEVTQVYIRLEKQNRKTIPHLVPIIQNIYCMSNLRMLEIPIAGVSAIISRSRMLDAIKLGYNTYVELRGNNLKLTEVYECIPSITPQCKHGVKLARDNKVIDEYYIEIKGITKKTTRCFYLKGVPPLYFKRPITESQLLTLHTYKYDYFLKYNKKRSEYTLVCKKRDTDTPLESSEKLINS